LQTTIHSLKKGEKAIIKDFDIDIVPLKLLEMGCLPEIESNSFKLSLGDPLYLNINGSHVAIRVETAREIEVEILKPSIMTNQNINVALIGNPNTGKTSVLIN
jgi:ferrous iron transport protein A